MNGDKTEDGDGKIPNKENREYAIHRAKVLCPFCTIPTGDLIVTSHNVMMQGKYTATVADCIPVTNINFKGQCTVAPGLVPPPCSAVIRLGKWMNFAPTVEIFGNKALLTESFIPCLMGGSQIRIVDSGQVVKKVKSEPMPKEITDAYWMDENSDKQHRTEYPDYPVTLYLRTMFYKAGETATVKFKSEEGKTFEGGQTELIVSGTVDEDGMVVIKDFKITYEEEEEQ